MRSAALMRTVHVQEEVVLVCNFSCSRQKLEQFRELLKEAFLVSQGASASVRPLTLPAPENNGFSDGLGLKKKLKVWETMSNRVVVNGKCHCGGLGWWCADLGHDEQYRAMLLPPLCWEQGMWLLVSLSLEKCRAGSAGAAHATDQPSYCKPVQVEVCSSALEAPLTNNSCFLAIHIGLYSLSERDFIVASKEEISNYFSALHLQRKALTFWHMVIHWKQFAAKTNFWKFPMLHKREEVLVWDFQSCLGVHFL